MECFGDDIGQGNQRQAQVIIGRQRTVFVSDTQRQGGVANALAHPVADKQAGRHGPQHAVQRPVEQPGAVALVVLQEQQAEDNEREGDTVVEPGFAGQSEAYPVVVPRVIDLDQARQHRVGRRQDRADQQCRAPGQAQQIMQYQAQPGDGHHHDRRGEAHRYAPDAIAQGQP
ncbi:hypothetical protein D9M71_411970 [compost metagenome]